MPLDPQLVDLGRRQHSAQSEHRATSISLLLAAFGLFLNVVPWLGERLELAKLRAQIDARTEELRETREREEAEGASSAPPPWPGEHLARDPAPQPTSDGWDVNGGRVRLDQRLDGLDAQVVPDGAPLE